MRYVSELPMRRQPPSSGPPRPPQPSPPSPPPPGGRDQTIGALYDNGSAKRVYTDAVMVDSLSKQYPELDVTIVPTNHRLADCDLLQFAALGYAKATPIDESSTNPLKWRIFGAPERRTDPAIMYDQVHFGKYMYEYEKSEFILYVAICRDDYNYPGTMQYLVGAPKEVGDNLISACCKWSLELHGEIWVFDGGWWDKSSELYEAVEKSSWDDVILAKDMKDAIQEDVYRFFQSREKYVQLKVPWKRGIIYHGPPGNGKTISIKAMMHTLNDWKEPVPALYVRSFRNIYGEEQSIKDIFDFARTKAPCLLVFEDLDSLVKDNTRSYFLNEIDGISQSLGVLMIGSTNHLDRLDPGLSKRPSRFDRKFEFPKPDFDQRVQYCEYWREKLKDNKDIEFPHELSEAIAEITDDFSFAYMQEAFVASLLAIASKSAATKQSRSSSPDLDDLLLWREIKKQVKILKDEM